MVYSAVLLLVYMRQGSLLFFPSHDEAQKDSPLSPWLSGTNVIGYCYEVQSPRAVWLMTHGNGGQASERDYVLNTNRFATGQSLYILEYPGYGARPGTPSMPSINRATEEGYRLLRARFPKTPVCVLGESIGTGPASALARQQVLPDKIVLAVPYDALVNVAAEKFWFLPVRLLLKHNWNNVESLRNYSGPVEIYAGLRDGIIPVRHAKALAAKLTKAKLILMDCGHNDWAEHLPAPLDFDTR